MAQKLDRTRDFGTIYGDPGLAFEQDGVHFKGDGSVGETWSTPEKIQQERQQAEKRLAREAQLGKRREAQRAAREAAENR